MNNLAPFPIISVEGEPHDMGRQYGSQAKVLIADSLDNYRLMLEHLANLKWDRALDLTKRLIPSIEEFDSDAVDEMRGIAKGADRTFEEIVLLGARSELVRIAAFEASVAGRGERLAKGITECSAFAVLPEATTNKHTLIGQNWDWAPSSQKQTVIVRKKKKGKPNMVTLVEAGVLAKQGINSAGLGTVGNGLYIDKMQAGVPLQFLANKILSSESFVEAIRVVLSAKRSGSSNRIIASSDGQAIDLELALDDYNVLYPEGGIIAHTNHFIGSNPNIKDIGPAIILTSTLTRRYRLLQLLSAERGNITAESMQRILRDHLNKPDSLCMHVNHRTPGMQYQTNASLIYDLNDMSLTIAKGPPCENEYVTLPLQNMF